MSNIPNQDRGLSLEKGRSISYLKISHPVQEEHEILPGKTKRIIKRSFDLVASLLVSIFLLSWLLPLLAFFIKLSSRGPVFFIQKRVGAQGKTFDCIKLRTMIVNPEANLEQARENDPRITPLGKFLRLSCLDELPQFFNVLMGHMSIVGPRPHMIKDCREFSRVIQRYDARTLVKPGITGMAQVKGYRGKTHNFYDVSHRFKWDMFYVRNLSFILDMQIIGLTIVATFTAVYRALFHRGRKQEEKVVEYRLELPEFLN